MPDVVHPLDALESVIKNAAEHIHDYTHSPSDFTRNRKLTAERFIRTTLNMESERISMEMDKAFPDDPISASAYEQAKAKVSPALFEDLFYEFNKTNEDVRLMDNKYRILAIDGSDFTPPFQKKSKYALPYQYGRPRKDGTDNKPVSQIHGNLLFDLLGKTYEGCVLQPRSVMDERSAAVQLLEDFESDDPYVAVMDRGYEGFNFIEHLNRIPDCSYIIRSKNGKGAVKEIQDLPDEECDTEITFTITTSGQFYRQNRKEIPHLKYIPSIRTHYKDSISKSTKDRKWDFEELCEVTYRVVKIKINDEESGKETWETLITNLNRFEFPAKKLKKMYRMRWGIETSFRNLKYAIGAVSFHSRRDDFVEMELFAHLTSFNAASRTVAETSVPQNTKNKHTYAIDFNMAVHLCRKYLREFFTKPYWNLNAELLSYKVAVRPDRRDTRKTIRAKTAVWFVYRVA